MEPCHTLNLLLQFLYFQKAKRTSQSTLALAQAFPQICMYWAMLTFAAGFAMFGYAGSTIGNVFIIAVCGILAMSIISIALFFSDDEPIIHSFQTIWYYDEDCTPRWPWRMFGRVTHKKQPGSDQV